MSGAGHTLGGLGLLDGALVLGAAATPGTAVTGITADSRETKPGFLFAAIKGASRDGARYIQYAVRMEAAAVLCTLEGAVTALETMERPAPVPLIVVDDPRRTLSSVAAALAGPQPGTVAAITGTSGKTSTADFLRQIWTALGERAGAFGTMGVNAPGFESEGGLTTPDPVALHALLARLADGGVTHVAMEASSHGLDQRRLDGVRVAGAAITNVARDHMDYHPTSAHYAAAKLRLFAELVPGGAPVVANADDVLFPLVAQIAKARGHRLIPLGEGKGAEAGLHLIASTFDGEGQALRFSWERSEREVRLPLVGAFQSRNVMTAAALAIGCGAEAGDVFGALETLVGVRGRMEHVATRTNGASVYVDYAHKPDAIAAALSGLRPHVQGRLHVVIGAGGDRDPGKRPLMGEAAAAHADRVIVTDDNPRSEDPASIRRAVMDGAPGAVEIGDRAEAIVTAIDDLEEGDVLLIAGKGHETGQVIGGATVPFDDATQARAAVAALDGDEDDIMAMLRGQA